MATAKAPSRTRKAAAPAAPHVTRLAPAPAGRGQTKVRHVRARDELWDPAAERAEREGFGISEVIRRFLYEYGRGGTPAP